MQVHPVQSVLQTAFLNQDLLAQALVHRSFLNEQDGDHLDSYERMEFLGDAVLELVISSEIYRRLPGLAEGELTKLRADLVCGANLSKVARRVALGEHLKLGKGEETTGGRKKDSILAAVFEAVVAAVYLDKGYEVAREFVLRLMAQELDGCCQQGKPLENPKSRLQEHFQGIGYPSPVYLLVDSEGPDHAPLFTMEAWVSDEVVGTGKGGKKVDAEQAAALDALSRLTGSEQMS